MQGIYSLHRLTKNAAKTLQKVCSPAEEIVEKVCRRSAVLQKKLCRKSAEGLQKLCRKSAENLHKLYRVMENFCMNHAEFCISSAGSWSSYAVLLQSVSRNSVQISGTSMKISMQDVCRQSA